MLNPLQLERIRNRLQWAVIASFLGLLWLPTLDSFFHWDKAPTPDENRLPAKFPAFNQRLDGIRDFVAGLESYYNDHFGFRKRLIRWNNHWKHELFRESPLPAVLTGREGWLYYSGDGMIENHLGLAPFQPNELREWQSLLETRRDWLARRGIRYVFVIAPNKESVYPEFLPAWLAKERSTSKLDQFLAYMKTNSTVEVLDLRPSLLEAKKSGRVYLMTDTHWNEGGAFAAHQELMRTLSRQLPLPEPLSLASFKKTFVQWKNGGDLARMLGQGQTMLERDVPSFAPVPPLQCLDIIQAPQLGATNKWNKETYPVFTENSNRTGTAIVFRDSFSGGWVPFIGHYFGKVIYFWEYNWEPAFIEKEKPVVVIDEMVERLFYTASPTKLKMSDKLK
jgi:hypothetical protein